MKHLQFRAVVVLCITGLCGQPSLASTSSQQQAPVLKGPETFGKSHFIVGMPRKAHAVCQTQQPVECAQETSPYLLLCQGVFPQSFFCPQDDLRKALVHLVQQEQKSIKIAAYVLTDAPLAAAVCDAYKRGVDVRVVVDRSCLQMRGHKVGELRRVGIPVAVFDGEMGEEGAIMHNKFMLFGENLGNKSLVCTGSANMTKSAYGLNHENAIVLDDQKTYSRYDQKFAMLIKNAHRMTKS